MHDDPLPFGRLLKRYREAAGLTQEALAARANLSARGISDLERGVARMPRSVTRGLLAQALQLSEPERLRFEAAAARLYQAAAPRWAAAGMDPAARRLPFVGRTQELAMLERHVAAQGPPVLLLAGEPGIGKTRLLQEADARAVQRGWHVLAGGCSRSGGQEPYAPVLQALERDVQRQPHGQLRVLLQGCAWLVRLLPELADGPIEPLPTRQLPPEQERRLMFRAVARYFANVAGPAGTLLLLDDLQWAGRDAFDLVSAVLHTASPLPLRIIVAYRDVEVRTADPLTTWLVDLQRADQGEHHLLAPLVPEDAAMLLDQCVQGTPGAGTIEREQILLRTGGMPFFLRSCALALRAGASTTLPWDVAQSIRQRIAALSSGAQEVLCAAAVVGRVAERSVLLAVSVQRRNEVIASLDEACQVRLLEEHGDSAYCFAHDLVRETVYDGLTRGQKAEWHGRVADILEGLPRAVAVEILAYHYARSDAIDKAVRYLRRAGDHAMALGAMGAAERHYRDLAARLCTLGRYTPAAAVHARLGLVLSGGDRTELGIATLEQALQMLIRQPELACATRLGPPAAAVASEAMLAQIEACATDEERGDLYIGLATLLRYREQAAAAVAVAERAIALARRTDNPVLLGHALIQLGDALNNVGRSDQALRVTHEALHHAERQGSADLLLYVLECLPFLHRLRGEFDRASAYAERYLASAAEVGDPGLMARALFARAVTALDRGAWDHAEQDVARALTLGPDLAPSPFTGCLRAELMMVRGDWDGVSALQAGVIAEAIRTGNRQAQTWMERVLVKLDILQGDAGAALARLERMLQREQLKDAAWMLPDLALAKLHLGHLEEASTVIDEAITRATKEGNRFTLVDALRVKAIVAVERQAWAEAAASLAEGLALARSMPSPYTEARLFFIHGLLHLRQDAQEPAKSCLDDALAIFRRLGARKDIERTEQLLIALG